MYRKRKRIYAVAMLLIIVAAILLQSINLNNDEHVYQQTAENTEQTATVQDALSENNGQAADEAAESTSQDEEAATTEEIVTDESGDGAFALCGQLLDEDTEREIDSIIAQMTVEEKVGQLFFIKDDGRFRSNILAQYPVGGIILFDGDFKGKSAQNLKDYISAFQENSNYPLLIGVDEEGGTVIRLSKYSTYADAPFQSPRNLYSAGGFEAISDDTVLKSELLLSYGINVNFAPVCDISGNPEDFMYNRSVSGDVDVVSEFAALSVSVMHDEGIGSVLKHFPGYGSNGDTHTDVIRDSRDYDTFAEEDFKPFQAGIDAGADCVLVSHNIVECMDSDMPASLSYEVHRILRSELGFNGVIITDDLMMRGVSTYVDENESAVQAILAGNDMILSTYYDVQYQAVLDAVNEGVITEARLDASVRRILRWKYSLGIMDMESAAQKE